MADYDNKTTAPWSEFADQINKVVIGNSVTTVGDDAFMGCVNLTLATLGSNLRSIGKSAFYMCDLSEVAIPDTVETIKERAFRYNKYLKTATLGSQLKTIGIYSFANCALTEIIIPDQVTEIDLYAFADTPLTKAMIPASVKTIVVRAFGYRGDDPVEDFTIYGYSGTAAETYADENGFNFVDIEAYSGTTGDCEWSLDPFTGVMTVSGNGKMGDYVNPFDDESVGSAAPWWDFKHEITAVVIGDGVTHVGEYAFFLANTESLTLGKKVVSIGESAFYGNELTEVVIPDSVEVIDEGAFSNNQDLTDVTFGRNLQFICGSAFLSCDLRSVVFPDSLLQIREFAFFDNNNLSSVKFGENLDYIDKQAFLNCGLDEVEIPESVTWLGYCSLGCIYYESQMYSIDDFTIRGYSGTSAEDYAKAYGFTFIPIGGTIVYGDVNGDGNVTIDDATLVQKAVAELAELDAKQQKAADVNGDDSVTIDNATLIQKYVAEIIDRFPVHALLG